MNLEEHTIKNNELLEKNIAIKSFVENAVVDDSIDLFEGITNIAYELEAENDTNKKVLENSLLDNILKEAPQSQNDYKISPTFEFLKEHRLVKNGFYTIAGFSSSGKTTFATQLALDILQNNSNTVLVMYTMDDSISFMVLKIIKQLLDNTYLSQKLSETYVNNSDVLYKYQEQIDSSIKKRIHIFENMSVFNDYSTKSIYNHLKTIKNYHSDIENLQIIVVIDYLQVIEHDYKDNREGLNRACKELKNIQKSFNCMLIALSQLSNEGNYRETSEIRNISDIIIKLYNEKEYLEREKKKSVDNEHSFHQ